jgi:hypothetical protein
MKVFIAGIMQGNRKDKLIHSQDYREIISNKLDLIVENVEVIDPDKTDPDRLSYNHEQAKEMFFKYCKIAGEADLLIAYIPEASMGSAVEMWMAYQARIPIVTISSMKANWVIKLLSNEIYETLEEFIENFDNDMLSKLKTI